MAVDGWWGLRAVAHWSPGLVAGRASRRSLVDTNQDPHSNGGSDDARTMALTIRDLASGGLIDCCSNHPLIIKILIWKVIMSYLIEIIHGSTYCSFIFRHILLNKLKSDFMIFQTLW